MRIVKTFLGILLALVVFSSTCLAVESDGVARKLNTLAQYKSLASAYAFMVQDLYKRDKTEYEAKDVIRTPELTDKWLLRTRDYLLVRKSYLEAAAMFDGWNAAIGLKIVTRAIVPSDDVYLGDDSIAKEAISTYEIFQEKADNFINDYHIKGERSGLLVEAALTSILLPGIDSISAAQQKNEDAKKEKRLHLLSWLDKYYKWSSWDSFSPPPAKDPGQTNTTSTKTTTKTVQGVVTEKTVETSDTLVTQDKQ